MLTRLVYGKLLYIVLPKSQILRLEVSCFYKVFPFGPSCSRYNNKKGAIFVLSPFETFT